MIATRFRILFLVSALFGLNQCAVEGLESLGGTNTRGDVGGSVSGPSDSTGAAPGGNYITNPGNAPSGDGGEDRGGSFAPGTPIDIPVPVAKVINPRSLNALLTSQEVIYTAQADPNVTVRVYNHQSNAVNEVLTDEQGNFSVTVPLASVPLEQPVSFVVAEGEAAGPPVTVMTYGDNTFTVALTMSDSRPVRTIGGHSFTVADLSDYSIGNWDLAYSPRCQGVAYNATYLPDGHYSILCVNTLDVSTVILVNRLSRPLDQMQFSPDGRTLVGLTPDKHLIHVNLDTGAETVISDMPIDVERPTVRLSPDGAYVLTTGRVMDNSHYLAVLEKTDFTPLTVLHDRIVINRASGTESITQCEWINGREIQCVFRDDAEEFCCLPPDAEYNMLRYDLGQALGSGERNLEIEPDYLVRQVQWASTMKNLRIRPAPHAPLFTYETANSLRMNDYTREGTIASTTTFTELTSVTNSRWAVDGKYLYLNATFTVGAHPGKPKVIIYTPPYRLDGTYGAYCFAGYGARPTWADPNDSDILAYICDDQRGGKQICVLNKDTLN